jgi:DNA-binding XRE family transcriptional regulator
MTTSDSDFVKNVRAKLNLTQAELGKIVGKERRSIMRYEAGDELPPAVNLALKHLLSEARAKAAQKRKAKKKANGST